MGRNLSGQASTQVGRDQLAPQQRHPKYFWLETNPSKEQETGCCSRAGRQALGQAYPSLTTILQRLGSTWKETEAQRSKGAQVTAASEQSIQQ